MILKGENADTYQGSLGHEQNKSVKFIPGKVNQNKMPINETKLDRV